MNFLNVPLKGRTIQRFQFPTRSLAFVKKGIYFPCVCTQANIKAYETKQLQSTDPYVSFLIFPNLILQVMTTKIEILDVNDNPPEFKEPTVELVFSESANIGSSRILMPATDPDSPVFGVHSYKLLPNDTELGLISPEEEGSGGHLRLYVRSELDREKKAQYSFKVITSSHYFNMHW